MVFSSTLFLFAFLPVVLLLYFIVQPKFQNAILLIASIFFYASGEPKFVFVMLASVFLNYCFALLIVHPKHQTVPWRRFWLVCATISNLGLLFLFKYLAFSLNILNTVLHCNLPVPTIKLPIGISFFTFQALSYVIDVYRGNSGAQRNLFSLALYVSFFPQLIAGPIVRYNTIAEQIDHRIVTKEKFSDGVQRFIIGFSKKVILANNLALVAENAFSPQGEKTVLLLWVGSLAYSLQIFFDFCGYSDMAIGLGKMFGFTFEENFNYPYIAASITDFWHRWHISLSQWFRDYVYFPLGGSRVSHARHIFNLFAVWFLTGLWHGANYTFIVWGMIYFLMQILEKYFIKPHSLGTISSTAWRVATLLVVNFNWILFNSSDIFAAKSYIAGMLGCHGLPLLNAELIGLLREYGAFLLFGILFSTPIAKAYRTRINTTAFGQKALPILLPVCYILVFCWAASFVVLGAHNPFIYFNF